MVVHASRFCAYSALYLNTYLMHKCLAHLDNHNPYTFGGLTHAIFIAVGVFFFDFLIF